MLQALIPQLIPILGSAVEKVIPDNGSRLIYARRWRSSGRQRQRD